MTIQPVASLKEFFRDALHDALAHQRVAVEDQTEHYVVNLLTLFSDADALFEREAPGAEQRSRLKPLALMLVEALEAPTQETRFRGLQRLGDVSLFIAGFFSAGFARKLVDIDYHIAMGGRAYGTLAEHCSPARGRTLRQVFSELAAKFTPMVDALNEISESSYQHSDRDRLRLYETWVKTGSERSRMLLRRLGIEPTPAARSVLARSKMSVATLASLQSVLAEIYDLPATPDIAQFLLTDRAHLASVAQARSSDEQLIVVEHGDTLSLALYIDAQVLERLGRCDPFAALTQHNLADYLTVAEGVSHFVYVAWNAGFDKPVTLLELELQAEVDKYVLSAWLLRAQGEGRFPSELHRALFERARVDPTAAAGRTGLYQTASSYGGRFCRRVAASLARGTRGATRELLTELRRFYRWGNARKLRHIERFA